MLLLGKMRLQDAFVMGHSFGGATALLAASRDARFKVENKDNLSIRAKSPIVLRQSFGGATSASRDAR